MFLFTQEMIHEAGCFDGMSAAMKKRRWSWEDEKWQAVKIGTIDDKSIVDGMKCCRICRERFPETKAWQKFIHYTNCECFSYPDNFDPLDQGLSRSHGAYSIGICG